MTTPRGTLHGIGLGPGDPDLITVQGLRLLQGAATVFVPVSERSEASIAEAIAHDLLRPGQRLERLVQPMRASRATRDEAWRAHARTVSVALEAGDAAFLAEGDVSTFSTFAHLRDALAEVSPGVRCEAVPGVTSFAAAAARLGVTLVDGEERLEVLPGPHDRAQLQAALRATEALVLMKVSADLDAVLDALEAAGRTNDARFIERCGWPGERIVEDVRTLRGTRVDYFSIILVRKVLR